ncbi:MAG: LysR substrate-binding domain-containing protein [Clostridium fessum]
MQSSAEPSAPKQIALTPLFQEHYTAICAPGHPMAGKTVSINTFMKQPLLFREVGSTSYEVFQNAIRQTGCEVAPACGKHLARGHSRSRPHGAWRHNSAKRYARS